MKIEALDFFYLSMPVIEDIGDGSQDALIVRISADGLTGWGECEASPLPTIAAMISPMSHSACKPVIASVLGETLDSPADIARIGQKVHENSMDLLQADHALSGIDVALWDLLGQARNEPAYRLLGYEKAYPKTPYASVLFGDTPHQTLEKGRRAAAAGFRAVKFGWGPFGRRSVLDDVDQVAAAREGIGPDAYLCIDAGTVWGTDLHAAIARLNILQEKRAHWLEEPFHTGALSTYKQLSALSGTVPLAGGEGAHNEHMAQHMIDYAGVGFVQIDAGRIGGLTPAKRVADYAAAKGVTYVNHTFTSHLALVASIQPFAGLQDHVLCEYPVELKAVAYDLTDDHLMPDSNGQISLPERPGLGLKPNPTAMKKYLVDTEITVGGKVLYRTPQL